MIATDVSWLHKKISVDIRFEEFSDDLDCGCEMDIEFGFLWDL